MDKNLERNSSGALLLFFLFMTILIGYLFESVAVAEPTVNIKPVLTTGARWDSNFFLTEEDEQALYTFLVSPGVTAEVNGARTNITFNYNFEAYYYKEADEASSETEDGGQTTDEMDYTGHVASLSGSYDVTSRLTLGLDAGYTRTRYPTYYDRLSTQTWDREYELFHLTPALYFDITQRLTAGLRYRTSELDFGSEDDFNPDELDVDNTEENTWMLEIDWTPQPSVSVGVGLKQANIDYVDRLDDYEAQKINLNIQKRFRIIALDGAVGYDKRDYQVEELEDQELVTWRLGLTAQAQPTGRQGSLGKPYIRPVDHLHFSVGQSFNTLGDLYIATRFVGTVGSQFGDKFEGRIKGWYQISDYGNITDQTLGVESADRELETWDISASLGYHIIRNLVLAVTVGHREEKSNYVNDEEYTNTYGLIEFSFNFDFWRRGGFTNEALYY